MEKKNQEIERKKCESDKWQGGKWGKFPSLMDG